MTDSKKYKIYFNKALMISEDGNYLGKDMFDNFLDNDNNDIDKDDLIKCEKGYLIPYIHRETYFIYFFFFPKKETENIIENNAIVNNLTDIIKFENIKYEIKNFFTEIYDVNNDNYVVNVLNTSFEIKKDFFYYLFESLYLIKNYNDKDIIFLNKKNKKFELLDEHNLNNDFEKYTNFYHWIKFINSKIINSNT